MQCLISEEPRDFCTFLMHYLSRANYSIRLSVHSFCENQTYDLGVASTMVYCIGVTHI